MERPAAEAVFALMADLKGELRDRQVTERWWLVWIVLAFVSLGANLATQALLRSGEERLWPFLLVWSVNLALLPLVIKTIHRGRGGQRSRAERDIWWIWATFLIAASVWTCFQALAGRPIFDAAPAVALLAAVGWSAMAMAVHPAFLWGVALFLATSLGMLLLPGWQFLLYGLGWFATLMTLGLWFRPRRAAGGAEAL